MESVNAVRYCESLEHLREAIRRKRPGLLSNGLVLLQDNATPHKSVKTLEWLQKYNWETLEHPAYSPDLAPSDYHLFCPFKRAVSGRGSRPIMNTLFCSSFHSVTKISIGVVSWRSSTDGTNV